MVSSESNALGRLEWELLLTSLSEGDSHFSAEGAGADVSSDLAELAKLVRTGQYLEVFNSTTATKMLPLPSDSMKVGPRRPNEIVEEAQRYYDELRGRVSEYLDTGASFAFSAVCFTEDGITAEYMSQRVNKNCHPCSSCYLLGPSKPMSAVNWADVIRHKMSIPPI
eukprot:1379318-Pyramimonas_sp.AAC.1